MGLDLDDPPNLNLRESTGLSLPIYKNRRIFEKDFSQRRVDAKSCGRGGREGSEKRA